MARARTQRGSGAIVSYSEAVLDGRLLCFCNGSSSVSARCTLAAERGLVGWPFTVRRRAAHGRSHLLRSLAEAEGTAHCRWVLALCVPCRDDAAVQFKAPPPAAMNHYTRCKVCSVQGSHRARAENDGGSIVPSACHFAQWSKLLGVIDKRGAEDSASASSQFAQNQASSAHHRTVSRWVVTGDLTLSTSGQRNISKKRIERHGQSALREPVIWSYRDAGWGPGSWAHHDASVSRARDARGTRHGAAHLGWSTARAGEHLPESVIHREGDRPLLDSHVLRRPFIYHRAGVEMKDARPGRVTGFVGRALRKLKGKELVVP
ncbi:hypothetical protein K488DRAFT_69663 [Vararia minispora EC-137]|uniref:Uncharacterized protein n=1 Tax=Vararia minispora EC-137 TaxID=1314806 RepID=A0ACB8QPJ6_9AGAM|nr:hypothetical protein K488DRAFT_69663 [Vararia minispora EC-137]